MKRIISMLLTILILLTAFTSCQSIGEKQNEMEMEMNTTIVNISKASNIDTVMSIFESVLAGDTDVVMNGKAQKLSHCSGYSGFIYEQPKNVYSYIDFDKDGITELFLSSSTNGEYILNYDFSDDTVYVTFYSPREGWICFKNGEFAYPNTADSIRYQIVSFNKGSAELKSVEYKDITPDSEQIDWQEIDFVD